MVMWEGAVGPDSVAVLIVVGIVSIALADIVGALVANYNRPESTSDTDAEFLTKIDGRRRHLRRHARHVWRRTRMARGFAKLGTFRPARGANKTRQTNETPAQR